MATVRITGNWRNPNRDEWAGAPAIDQYGRIERSLPLPEEAYTAVERGIRQGALEGTVLLRSGAQLHWLLDRSPTAAVPTGHVEGPPAIRFKHILVPVDLSDRHGRALEIAAGLVAPGGEVTLLHVIELVRGMPRDEEADFYGRLESKSRAFLDRLVGGLRGGGVTCRGETLFGRRVGEVLAHAQRAGSDLIVLASHTAVPGEPEGWGTLSHQIAALSPCPVLLVK
jgi:nucleotide-binding universal stress UspA family protein